MCVQYTFQHICRKVHQNSSSKYNLCKQINGMNTDKIIFIDFVLRTNAHSHMQISANHIWNGLRQYIKKLTMLWKDFTQIENSLNLKSRNWIYESSAKLCANTVRSIDKRRRYLLIQNNAKYLCVIAIIIF